MKYSNKPTTVVQQFPKYVVFKATVTSNSMNPSITKGDIVVIQNVPMSMVHVGDIIVYSSHNQTSIIVHRVVQITNRKNRQLITKGDQNTTNDCQRITERRYIGKVITIEKTLRGLFNKLLLTIGF